MFKALQNGWTPPQHITEQEYKKVQANKSNFPDYYVGFIGFMGSYASKYFGGYARAVKSDGVTLRDMPHEAIKNLLTQLPNLKDIIFTNFDIEYFYKFSQSSVNDWLIYCDPPYQYTTKYSNVSFNYDKFWNWVRDISKSNHVFISEYNAPNDFDCIWAKSVTTALKVYEHEPRIEKLFRKVKK